MNYKRAFNYIILIFGILCLLYYLGMGLAVRFGQSLLFLWPIVGIACVARFALVEHSMRSGIPLPISQKLIKVFRICLVLALSLFAVTEAFIYSAALAKPESGLDCIIVLGARVNGKRPSGALAQRIVAASDYLRANPDTICVASGGQGYDEEISEASCIIENLAYLDVSFERMICEDKSTSTLSNIENSLALLPDGVNKIGIVTNDFHIFRALATARHVSSDYDFSPIPATSTAYGFVHYAMREFFALGAGLLKGELEF